MQKLKPTKLVLQEVHTVLVFQSNKTQELLEEVLFQLQISKIFANKKFFLDDNIHNKTFFYFHQLSLKTVNQELILCNQ